MNTLNLLAEYSSSHGAAAAAVVLGLLVVCVFSLCVWLSPGLIASARHHHNAVAIWLVTIFAGWTFVGWIVALVWAFSNPPPAQQVYIHDDKQLN